jgi:predicted transposase YdaD
LQCLFFSFNNAIVFCYSFVKKVTLTNGSNPILKIKQRKEQRKEEKRKKEGRKEGKRKEKFICHQHKGVRLISEEVRKLAHQIHNTSI